MNRVNRFLQIIITLTALFWSTFSFAQEDSVTFTRTVGDFVNITISGARNGDFANVELIKVSEIHSHPILNAPPSVGGLPGLNIYAAVVTGGDVNATSRYSESFQMELPGTRWGIALYVADTLSDYQIGNFSMVDCGVLDKVFDYPNDDYYLYLDVTDSSFEAQPEGVITIRNLKVRGFDERKCICFYCVLFWGLVLSLRLRCPASTLNHPNFSHHRLMVICPCSLHRSHLHRQKNQISVMQVDYSIPLLWA
jgi:hypothetical protein